MADTEVTKLDENSSNESKIVDKELKFQNDMDSIFKYISNHTYPEGMKRDGKKDFRRKCALFKVTDGSLYYIGIKQGRFYLKTL